MSEAFVTLATNDEYATGAIVWANSLRKVGTEKKIAALISKDVSQAMQNRLSSVIDDIIVVNVLDSRDTVNLDLLSRPNLGVTFTKLHCWRLTQYSKCVFMDADTLVVQNIDDLFSREEFSAAPDPGWPDCFNSGVFVFRPSIDTYKSLLSFALSIGSFDGGDQGLLNQYYSNWATVDIHKHLPFTYNCVSQAFYSYLPAAQYFHSQIKVVHFIGPVKPWHHEFNQADNKVVPRRETGFSTVFLQKWWDIFRECVLPTFTSAELHISNDFTKIELPQTTDPSSIIYGHSGHLGGAGGSSKSERDRQYAWERGEIDYEGADRFDNILNKINSEMKIGDDEQEDKAASAALSPSTSSKS